MPRKELPDAINKPAPARSDSAPVMEKLEFAAENLGFFFKAVDLGRKRNIKLIA
jgi:hypothetical protein